MDWKFKYYDCVLQPNFQSRVECRVNAVNISLKCVYSLQPVTIHIREVQHVTLRERETWLTMLQFRMLMSNTSNIFSGIPIIFTEVSGMHSLHFDELNT